MRSSQTCRVGLPGRPAHRRGVAGLTLGLLVAAALLAPGASATTSRTGRSQAVIVTGRPGAAAAVERAVRAAGGSVTRQLPVINGVVAKVPADALSTLRMVAGVRSVTTDVSGHFASVSPALGYDPATDSGSLDLISKVVGAQTSWSNGYAGAGVDIAMIDSGVALVAGLTNGNIVNGPDLSFDSQNPALTQNDAFGHGTHMASIMVGRDTAETSSRAYVADSSKGFVGVAPDARVVSVKVGAGDGSADVSQVIAAIDWVVQHAHDPGFNMRVLNLSYGTNSGQRYDVDPLAYAAESAWQHGIVVVAAGGNDGTSVASLSDPAYDPMLLAVGADDPMGTVRTADDTVPAFASHGTAARHVDLIAPGVHVLGLRVPGSAIDAHNPGAVVGGRFFRGSGTSQATAVTSAAVALLLQRSPQLTPDQVKQRLVNSTHAIKDDGELYRGSGLLSLDGSLTQSPRAYAGTAPASTGTGTLDAARGGAYVLAGGVALRGERDIFGRAFTTAAMAACAATASCWSGGNFNGASWSGASWSGASWSGASWSGASWSGASWSGASWSGASWSGASWSGASWSGASWSGASWSGSSWTGASWSGASWSGASWSGASWSGASWSSASWS